MKIFNNEDIKVYAYNNYTIVDENIFYKGIYLKEEIGFFIYFIKETDYYPYISIKQCNKENKMVNYNFDKIAVSISTFNSNYFLNDVIKLNNYQVCYISTSSDYILFKFVTFTLYNFDKSMIIRYYEINILEKYEIKFILII